MFYRIEQKGFTRPVEKQVLNSGLIVICENIVEDATNPNQVVYTWLESRYNQQEYMQVIEHEKDLLKKENQQLWDIAEKYLREKYTF
ncbi:MAG: hypothetical protein ACRDD7_03555 [Peptostreptococcaceae bacterium]